MADSMRKKRIMVKFLSTRPLYYIWGNMKKRCGNKNDQSYPRYGGRGITVCKRWLDYKSFQEDMLEGYAKGLQLDRVDNDEGYCPENCKWSTPREQSNNRSDNRHIEFDGKRKTLSAWARELGVKRSTLAQRFYSYKWSIKKTLTYNI